MDAPDSAPAQASLFPQTAGSAGPRGQATARPEAAAGAANFAALAQERRRMVRGLLLTGLFVLAFTLARAGLARVFFAGWWRQL